MAILPVKTANLPCIPEMTYELQRLQQPCSSVEPPFVQFLRMNLRIVEYLNSKYTLSIPHSRRY
jgi:hypothetical protein